MGLSFLDRAPLGALEPEAERQRRDRAISASKAVAREAGVRFDGHQVLRASQNLCVRLGGTGVVARIAWTRDGGEDRLARGLAVMSFLAQHGAPVVRPHPSFPDEVVVNDGFRMVFLEYQQATGRITRRRLGRSLRELHEAMKAYPDSLPSFEETFLFPVERLLAGRQETGALTGAERSSLTALLQETTAVVAGYDLPRLPLHGDAHAGNLIATPRGALWHDFDGVCEGSAHWDVACMGGDRRAKAAYGPLDRGVAKDFRTLREIYIAVWCKLGPVEGPIPDAAGSAALSDLRRRHGF